MKFFDWRKCDLLLDGVKVTNWAPGDDVFKMERVSPSVTSEVGADGNMTVSLNADKSVKITIKLAQTSPMNGYLSKLCAAQDFMDAFVPIQATYRDHYRQDEGGTTAGYIEKHADVQRGTKANVQEWVMVFERGAVLLGDPLFSGLLTATAEALGG